MRMLFSMVRCHAALLFALLPLLSACAPGGAPAAQASAPAGTPILFAAVATASPAPVTPAPVTPVPEPTALPDPFVDGMARETLREGFYSVALNDALKERITGLSYPAPPADCLVPYEALRYLRIRYVDFSGAEQEGELIVNERLAPEVLEIFAALYDARYPLSSVRLVDDFGQPGDDTRSMEADNTSAFCYRSVAGSEKLSRHSYGAAIDINPMRNPYIRPDGSIVPENGAAYADRSADFPGRIDEDDLCYRLFTERGWEWGGHFKTSKDYQHFSKDISAAE